MKPQILSIIIVPLEWRDKFNGNTYFSARVYLTYKSGAFEEVILPFQYGHSSQVEYEAFEKMENAEIITDREHNTNGTSEPPFRYCNRKSIVYKVTLSPSVNQSVCKYWGSK